MKLFCNVNVDATIFFLSAPARSDPFRTAHDQLIENLAREKGLKPGSYGASRRTLGNTRGGFKPPVLGKDENEAKKEAKPGEEDFDPRLKSIDPKVRGNI